MAFHIAYYGEILSTEILQVFPVGMCNNLWIILIEKFFLKNGCGELFQNTQEFCLFPQHLSPNPV